MSKLDAALAALRRSQEAVNQILASMRRFPEEPGIGTVLVWEHTYEIGKPRYGGKTYHYAALRAGDGRWYITGRDTFAYEWDDLVEKIGDNTCRVTVTWKDVPGREVD